MREKILMVGGGGHCRAVIDVIEQEAKYEIAGIIDKRELIGSKIFGYEIIGCDDDLVDLYSTYSNALVTVGQIRSNVVRVKLFNRLKDIGYTLPTVISSLAYISKYAKIAEGTVVMHQALVNANANIGSNCIINTKALIEHDAVIHSGCHISTGAIINGGVIVKANSFVGSNTTSKEYIEINGFIKAGGIAK